MLFNISLLWFGYIVNQGIIMLFYDARLVSFRFPSDIRPFIVTKQFYVLISNFIKSVAGFNTGLLLTSGMTILVYAYVVRFLAVAYNPIQAGFRKLNPHLLEASKSLGKGNWQTLLQVNLPISKVAMISGTLLVFVDIMKELPMTLLLRPFNFETLATYSYQFAHDELIEQASLPALLIILAGLVPVIFMNKFLREIKV